MAEDEERLISLLESISFDEIEGCLAQGAYSSCKFGEGGGFGAVDEFEFDQDFEEAFSE